MSNISIHFKNESQRIIIYSYFLLLNEAIEHNSFNDFKVRDKEAFTNLQNWFEPGFNSIFFSYKTEIKRISEIYSDNYDRFISEVWPIEQKKIRAKIIMLNQKLVKLDYIALWEKLTKLTFKYNRYEITAKDLYEKGISEYKQGLLARG